MSRHGSLCCLALERFPRVSGDEPTGLANRKLYRLFSPRERG